MGEIKIRELIITTLLAIVVIVGMGTFIGDFADSTYNKNLNTSFIDSSKEYVDVLEENQENLQDNIENFQWWNPVDYITSGASVVATLISTIGVVSDFITSLPNILTLGGIIPSWFMTIIIIILVLIMIFEVISMYMKYEV